MAMRDEVRLDLIYGYSDRCRYYWNGPAVQEEIIRLLDNLRERPIPLTLVSQYLPLEYEAIRRGELQAASRTADCVSHSPSPARVR